MERVFGILLLLISSAVLAQDPSVSVRDLLTLSSISPKNVDSYLDKKGFSPGNVVVRDGVPVRTYLEKDNRSPINRSIDLYRKGDTYCISFRTTSFDDFSEGNSILKSAGFFYDADTSRNSALVFKKGSIIVRANANRKGDSSSVYNFLLQKKEYSDPGNVQFAEDLLKFDSHEHLANYFGPENVKKDVYNFSPGESSPCTVLFPNSSRQVVFIWEDELNYYKISFILVSGVIQTASTAQFNGNFSQNKWHFKSGIYLGMRLKDLLDLNANDFSFFGRKSEYSMMVVPEKTRYIDFRKVGIMFECFDCYSAPILESEKVSATAAAEKGLSLYVSCIMISP